MATNFLLLFFSRALKTSLGRKMMSWRLVVACMCSSTWLTRMCPDLFLQLSRICYFHRSRENRSPRCTFVFPSATWCATWYRMPHPRELTLAVACVTCAPLWNVFCLLMRFYYFVILFISITTAATQHTRTKHSNNWGGSSCCSVYSEYAQTVYTLSASQLLFRLCAQCVHTGSKSAVVAFMCKLCTHCQLVSCCGIFLLLLCGVHTCQVI